MKRALLFIACVLASVTMHAQEEPNEYLPFVKKGKTWHVVRSDYNLGHLSVQYALSNEEEVRFGKSYMKMNWSEGKVTYTEGLLREENRKVFLFDEETQKEFLVFDFSLEAGDTYETYSYDDQAMVTYRVLSVDNYLEGPEAKSYRYDEKADTMALHRRYLRKWTVCRTDDESHRKTWIEGVGSLEGPLANLFDSRPVSSRDCVAYVVYNNNGDILYLPFTFCDALGHVHGSNLPTGKANRSELDWRHQLTYELDGDRLHVYGEAFTNCGPNNYAFFTEEPTDDPLLCKLRFYIQEVVPMANCMALHPTDFYVPGFDPNMNYVVVDNLNEEHPVVNKTPRMAYHPFIEEGKVWVIGASADNDGVSTLRWTDYCYFEGDSIIGGQTCKLMKCNTIINEEDWANSLYKPVNYAQIPIGAFYEQDKKVYFAPQGRQTFELLYDFTLSSNDTVSLEGLQMIVNKRSGGIRGFKGTYYDFKQGAQVVGRWLEGVGSESWPYIDRPWAYDGAGGLLLACYVGDEVLYCNSEEGNPYVMESRKRFDFTHTIKTKPKAPRKAEANPSLYGEYNEQQLDINLDPLDDVYLVRIADASGKALYVKTINAGNIVGLNIDISAYATGRYMVTVENSSESFKGEFETQTAGIAETENNVKTNNTAIYNLQGQRIGFLQKGLNIVGGKKVYVK